MWDMSWTVRSIVSHSRSGRYVRMSGPRSQTTARTTRHKWDTCTAWWQHWNHNANKEMYDNQIISYSCHNRQEIYQMTQHEISWDSQQAYTLTEFFFIYGMISWLCHKWHLHSYFILHFIAQQSRLKIIYLVAKESGSCCCEITPVYNRCDINALTPLWRQLHYSHSVLVVLCWLYKLTGIQVWGKWPDQPGTWVKATLTHAQAKEPNLQGRLELAALLVGRILSSGRFPRALVPSILLITN